MCVYTYKRIHTAYKVLDVSPGVGTRHLEGPKIDWILALIDVVIVFVYVYNMYVDYAGRRDEILDRERFLFSFYLDMNFLPNMQSQRCERKTEDSDPSYTIPQSRVQNCLFKSNDSNHHHHHHIWLLRGFRRPNLTTLD